MNPRATAILAVVVLLAGAGVWWFEIRGADVRAEREEAEKRVFPGFEAEGVEWIELATRGGERARLEQQDGVWRLVEPLEFPADDAAATGLASALTRVLPEAAYDEPQPPDEYGLGGEPRVRFGVGGEEHVLRIGSPSPVGGNTYAATAADAPVYAVASYRLQPFDKTLDDLRDKRILRFEQGRVGEIRARWPGGGVRLERDLGGGTPGAWRVVEPVEDAADADTVDDLLSDLEFLRATAFREGGDPGSLEAAFTVELVVGAEGEGEPRTLRLAVGADEEDGTRDVQGPIEGAGYRVAAARLDDFPRRVDAYRDRTLARFVASDAARLELLFQGGGESHEVKAERDEDAWRSEPERVDPVKLGALVQELSALTAESVAAESAGEGELAGLGLDPPRVSLRVRAAPDEEGDEPEGAVLAEVQLGEADPERGIAARRPDRDIVYWLTPELGDVVPVSYDVLRSRFLLPEDQRPEDEGAEGEEAGEGAPADAPRAAPADGPEGGA